MATRRLEGPADEPFVFANVSIGHEFRINAKVRVQCAIVFSLVVRPDMQRYDESDSETDSESDSESDTEMTTVTVKTHSTTLRHAVERVPPRERKRHEALLEQSDVRECCLRSCTAQQSNHAYRCIVMATQPSWHVLRECDEELVSAVRFGSTRYC